MRYEYDSRGQPLSVAHAAVAGAPETVTRYAYDAAGRVASVSSDEGTFRLRYDSAGRREAVERPNGVTSSYRYDARDRVTGVEHRAPGGALLATFVPGRPRGRRRSPGAAPGGGPERS